MWVARYNRCVINVEIKILDYVCNERLGIKIDLVWNQPEIGVGGKNGPDSKTNTNLEISTKHFQFKSNGPKVPYLYVLLIVRFTNCTFHGFLGTEKYSKQYASQKLTVAHGVMSHFRSKKCLMLRVVPLTNFIEDDEKIALSR